MQFRPMTLGRPTSAMSLRHLWLVVGFAFVLLVPLLASQTASRTWTSTDGKQIQGELVEAGDKEIRIRRKADDRTVAIPLEQLSADNQQLIKSIVREKWQDSGLKEGPFAAKITGKYEKGVSQGGLNYQLFGKPAWDGKKRYPLLIWLHGSGASGTDNEAQMGEITKFFASSRGQSSARTGPTANPFFVLAPQSPSAQIGWDGKGGSDVMALIAELMDHLPVDSDRVYLTGISMGGFGTFSLAARHPDIFAAAVPLAGGGDPGQVAALVSLPLWIFHGEKDPTVPVQSSRSMFQAIKDAGGKLAVYTELPGEGHDIAHVYSDPELMRWLFTQKRSQLAASNAPTTSPTRGNTAMPNNSGSYLITTFAGPEPETKPSAPTFRPPDAGPYLFPPSGPYSLHVPLAEKPSTIQTELPLASYANGTGDAVRFNSPRSLAVDAADNVFVTDYFNDCIRKITSAGVVTTWAGMAGEPGYTDGPRRTAQFAHPAGIAVDEAGNLYVADSGNQVIRKISSEGEVTTLAGNPVYYPKIQPNSQAPGPPNPNFRTGAVGGYADGTGRGARFLMPRGLAVDSKGNVYVADMGNHAIRKITPAGAVTTFAGNPPQAGNQMIREYELFAAYRDLGDFADGQGRAARFWQPQGVAVDKADNVYVADTGNQAIRMITPDRTVTTLAGNTKIVNRGVQQVDYPNGYHGPIDTWVVDPGYLDGMGTKARFYDPTGVAVDNAGNLYVADSGNLAIRKITPDHTVTTLAGNPDPKKTSRGQTDPHYVLLPPGNRAFAYVNGDGNVARFLRPSALAVDANGALYVTDSNAIRKGVPTAPPTANKNPGYASKATQQPAPPPDP